MKDMEKKDKTRLLVGLMLFFMVNGMLVLMTSSLLVFLIEAYQLSYQQGGLLLTIQAVGSILTNFLSGPLSLRSGRRKTLLRAAAGFTASLPLIAVRPPLFALQSVLFLSGLSWGISNNMINFLVVRVTGGNSSQIIRVHTSFSVGAFIAPLLVALAVRLQVSWRWPVVFLAICASALFVFTAYLPVPESQKQKEKKKPVSLAFLRSWHLYLYMLILFLYVGVETGFSGWLVSYLTRQRSFDPAVAQSLLSTLWVAMIVGRIGTSFFSQHVRPHRYLLLEATGVAIAAFLLASGSQPALLVIAVVLLGLSMSACYGMVVTNASWLIAESAIASGLLMSLGGLGASIVPLFTGIIAEKSGILSGVWFLFGTNCLLLLLALINILFTLTTSCV